MVWPPVRPRVVLVSLRATWDGRSEEPGGERGCFGWCGALRTKWERGGTSEAARDVADDVGVRDVSEGLRDGARGLETERGARERTRGVETKGHARVRLACDVVLEKASGGRLKPQGASEARWRWARRGGGGQRRAGRPQGAGDERGEWGAHEPSRGAR